MPLAHSVHGHEVRAVGPERVGEGEDESRSRASTRSLLHDSHREGLSQHHGLSESFPGPPEASPIIIPKLQMKKQPQRGLVTSSPASSPWPGRLGFNPQARPYPKDPLCPHSGVPSAVGSNQVLCASVSLPVK